MQRQIIHDQLRVDLTRRQPFTRVHEHMQDICQDAQLSPSRGKVPLPVSSCGAYLLVSLHVIALITKLILQCH